MGLEHNELCNPQKPLNDSQARFGDDRTYLFVRLLQASMYHCSLLIKNRVVVHMLVILIQFEDTYHVAGAQT